MKKLVIFLLITLVIFSPFSLSSLFLRSQASDFTEIDGYEEWTQDRIVSGFLVIKPGATLVIRNGVTVSFNRGIMIIDGTVIVSGTKKNPVIFKKDSSSTRNYSININQNGRLVMRNVDVSGSGFGANSVQKNKIFNTVLANYATGGINVYGGWLNVQGCNFHDNDTPIDIESANPNNVKVNRSKFTNNKNFDVYYLGDGKSFDFRYNWWGNADGPSQFCYSPDECYYEKFRDEVDFSNWLTSENFHDPVIIIPGILGSQEKNGKWQMDLILHTYDNLYKEFANNGYTPEKDLFEFPYEWRDSNVENAKLLKTKIQEIKEKTHWPKVDIVAHSMGGLLAREYVESDYYQDDVDQLITLGTPHNGAPQAYLKWDGDGWFFDLADMYTKHIIEQESKEKGYADIFDYIHQRPILSLKELLPIYDYLQEVENNYQFKTYPNGYPRNEFLEEINNDVNKSKLNNVEFDKIIGDVENENSTISRFKVVKANMGKYWVDGYPLGFEIPIGDRGLLKSNGDRTVPLDSAESLNIKADRTLKINSVHHVLPTDAQKDILELLTGIRPAMESRDSLVKNIFIASVYSPVDIQIVAPNGKKAGKNFVTGGEYDEITGAYYSGFDTDNEFLTIPNPEDGEYKILTKGTGEGEYKIKMAKISEDENAPEKAIESTAEISGMAMSGSEKELKIEISGDEIIADQDKTPPTISITSPENKTYQNNEILEVKYDVSDDKSIKDKIKTEIFFDQNLITDNKIDLSLQHLGMHNISIKATDEAGNLGEEKAEFASSTDINSMISNVNHYFGLGLIKNPGVRNYLQAKLQLIKNESKIINTLQKTKMPPEVRERLLKTFKTIVNREINQTISQIQKEKSLIKSINPQVRELLVEGLKAIRF